MNVAQKIIVGIAAAAGVCGGRASALHAHHDDECQREEEQAQTVKAGMAHVFHQISVCKNKEVKGAGGGVTRVTRVGPTRTVGRHPSDPTSNE